MASSIRPLYRGARLSGPAKTVKIVPGQNLAIHRAVHTAKQGQILVVDGGSSLSYGPFGDILATCCQNQGIAGLVIDGAVRDVADIEALRFPVFCSGANPTATAKSDPGEIDIEITCGGVEVRPGDIIVGDDDGVVVIPGAIADDVAQRVVSVALKETEIKQALKSGKTTLEILVPGDQGQVKNE